jgi:EAL domain-containing protein (putative c-di-GMP-specific phosphodiesterase class I)/DNA-binding NarL/FixJ family response regulator
MSHNESARVLVIDDEEANIALLRSLLKKVGFKAIESTTDSRLAAGLASRFEPDLILLDLHMPHLDGYAILDQLAPMITAAVPVPVLVLTADITPEARQRALALGARDFVSKPFKLGELLLRIGNLVDTRMSQVALSRQLSMMQSNRDADPDDEASERRRRHRRIEDTIERRAISLAYQAIVDTTAGQVLGYEALARFASPPIEPPDVWFRNARDVGLGPHLELATLEMAIRDLDLREPETFLSINASETTLRSPALLDLLGRSDPSRIVLELEGGLLIQDLDDLARSLDRVRKLGVRFASDEAGAGSDGIHLLLAIRPEIIKIDRILVEDLDQDPARQALVGGLVGFARETGAQVVAEGVETAAEYRILASMGIDMAQGYWIARPSLSPLETGALDHIQPEASFGGLPG